MKIRSAWLAIARTMESHPIMLATRNSRIPLIGTVSENCAKKGKANGGERMPEMCMVQSTCVAF